MRLLQICANVKRTQVELRERDGKYQCPENLDNLFSFNTIQGYGFPVFQQVKEDARAVQKRRVAVSTAFSTEPRVSNPKEKGSLERPQVRKNRGFARFYLTVIRSKALQAVQMARGPRRSRTGSIKMALTRPRTP
jgi:hypothetical protein